MSRRSVVVALAVGLVTLMTLVGLFLAVAVTLRGGDGFGFGDRIALLELDGIIADDGEVIEQLRRFRRDPTVKGYVLAINSPGGVVAPSQSLYRELRRIREADERPVIASIGAIGASGGYYVALGADSIFALPGSITGSIGVIMEFPDASRLMEKVGVRMEVVKSADHKDLGSPFRPITPGDREILEAMVGDVYEQFVSVVAEERRLPVEAVRRIADGRVLSGKQALESRLIDRIGNTQDALAAAGRMAGLGSEPKIARPPEERVTLFDLLLGRVSAGSVGRWLGPIEESVGPRLKYVVTH